MTVVDKDISSTKKRRGQFLTPASIVDFCLEKIDSDAKFIIEPSCGSGAFLDAMRRKWPEAEILGIEVDRSLANAYTGPEKVMVQDLYDTFIFPDAIFIGNPPYRTPAASLRSHPSYIKHLMKHYGISGIKEEAVFFILQSIALGAAEIHYILPKAIFQNNSKGYASFINFLKNHVQLMQVWDIPEFPGVDQDLVFVSMRPNSRSDTFCYNGEDVPIDEFYGNNTDYIPFQKIFKKTYLGSVPCESLFLSISGEPLEHFRFRLYKLFHSFVDVSNLVSLLSYEGRQHIRSLKKANPDKIAKLLEYVEQTKKLDGFSAELFRGEEYYKPIQHRWEERFYFRHAFLKKAPFVYILNSNPCPSFYFPGNPAANSTDYFGFCSYDVNRNSGPGANRCVPLDVEDNLHDSFKEYWKQTGLPYSKIFDYILFVSKSAWYKRMKNTYHRFYFGIPAEFDKSYLAPP